MISESERERLIARTDEDNRARRGRKSEKYTAKKKSKICPKTKIKSIEFSCRL